MTADRLPALVGKLRLIPDEAREFAVDTDQALRRLRIPADCLETAVACGLPSAGETRSPVFDRADLLTVAMHAGAGAVAHALRLFLPRALAGATAGGHYDYRVSYLPRCDDPTHDGDCEYHLVLPSGEVRRTVRPSSREPLLTCDVRCADEVPELPAPARELLVELSGLDFALLPERVRRDTSLITRTGLADCTNLSLLLAQECGRRGITARRSYGLLLTPPFANRHYWVEILAEGRWLPVDPVLIGTMLRWGVLDPDVWHPARTLGSVLWRIAGDRVALTRHGEAEVVAAFAVSARPK